SGVKVQKGEALFPRIDVAKEMTKGPEAAPAVQEARATPPADGEPEIAGPALISIDDFAKVRLRAARVLAAEKVEKSDKLLKLVLSLGESEPRRTVVSGIAKHYAPHEMVNRQVVLVSNLKPAKLRGILSEGMILCASGEGEGGEETLRLVTVQEGTADGAEIK
ncbi:MAG: methionine--tRNA ligase subunit beta, partial [Clostridia bacterium]|nr:methionine--tRNA ligase subunit beta [Clostridia bacterium]